jgi:uncharacterized protein (DUF983 family)
VPRDLWKAIANGMRCRCPRCGVGPLYRRYLKIADSCSHCGLDLSGHRADDLPPYICITIVGHILIVGIMHYELSGAAIEPWVYLAIAVPLALILPLALLPSIKGGVVGLQWANGMHGFSGEHADLHIPPHA